VTVLDFQREFIEFALRNKVLRFGSFTLKSGRTSPYFFNVGVIHTGGGLATLGSFYAASILRSGLKFDVVFGPAYKGIPIAVSTAMSFAEEHGRSVPWSFNRKEAKDHGEGGLVVGAPLAGRVLVVDDVITAGTAMREVIGMVADAGAEVAAIVVAIDRQERGTGELSAVRQLEQEIGAPVHAIVTLDDVIEYLEETGEHTEHLDAVRAYRAEHGAP
jgi:orotate phosphoribosyltransferase